ncbi:MAG: CoA ester lyase [Deltaproteobacteria bacterium]|nr:CoA ester lyase [Deltaproteobacteria bacterium]
MNIFRTYMYVPGIQEGMLAKAPERGADAYILDLEDSVPFAEKERARGMVCKALPDIARRSRAALFVRVNGVGTDHFVDDLFSVADTPLTGICVPKIESPQQIPVVEAIMKEAERRRGLPDGALGLIVMIESALGLVQAYPILKVGERTLGVALGGEDYALDLDLQRTEGAEELSYARQSIAVAARAAGVQAIDMVFPDVNNRQGLIANTQAGRRMGFRAKQVIHPKQVAVVNELLSPTKEELSKARAVVSAFEEGEKSGKGAVALNGQMIDRPVFERARRLLSLVS